ncbi:P-loop containing nucleoside triphosphate hydrolase protein [Trematosphaeria pertusa]|uniref:5'-deoxynucleotidase n=1 Tax=Trematosphaeria pertusa TaxID=390896 RepID=A0A6A6J1I0_9PLEO|nr:P-loop containing nucleoside triphosphate hydrolase protein [Trematosphaeria pertusa]KAF2256579.1 P-loop containing nucleoside triphosphate hydrolase protein [Trematosphaeria pertusa]
MESDLADLDNSPLPFLHLMGSLKRLPRTGWLRTIENPESVAAHMYRLSLMGMLAPDNTNMERCIFLALCHDMAESVVGDIPTFAGVTKEHKYKLEDFGILYIESLLATSNPAAGKKIRNAWVEYEECKTPEARFVREMDKFECLIQAHEYEQMTFGEKDLEEFQGLSSKISSFEGKRWMKLLQQEREAHFAKRSQRTHVIFVIGGPGAGKGTQCALLSEEFGFQSIDLDELLREKADDPTYSHAKFIRRCIEEDVQVPVQLAISLLEAKINKGVREGKSWSLVCGFPKNMEHLIEFQEKVQKTNYALLLSCSPEELLRRSQEQHSNGADGASDVLRRTRDIPVQNAEVQNCLAIDGYFSRVNGDGSVAEVYGLVKNAVKGFVQHAEEGK